MSDHHLVDLVNGTHVNKWLVESKLGEGGFGAVYKVSKQEHSVKKFYAMKTESMKVKHVLKMDCAVMAEANKKRLNHIPHSEGTGIYRDFLYLVMTLAWKPLDELRNEQREKKFSMGCALSVGMQCLDAIEELHLVGFVHRDIKPSNYAIGRSEVKEHRHVYLLDFGMCRRYVDDKGVLRPPRNWAGFRGTSRYAPLSAHVRREQCRKDDVESWLYQTIELTRGILPWRSFDNMDKIAMFKESCRYDAGLQQLMGGCPREYIEILRYVDLLTFSDKPDYKRINDILRRALTSLKLNEFPYDWEVSEQEKKKDAKEKKAAKGKKV